MSGDTSCTVEEIWTCPFCGRPTWKIELPEQWGEMVHPNGEREQCYDDGITEYEDKRYVRELVLRIECEATKNGASPFDCPAMDESGAYWLHIYPDGYHHAYYY